jgi:hypothetical protein
VRALRARPCRSRSRPGSRPSPRLAGLLLPLQQRGFGHRLGQLRDLDFNDCHDFSVKVRGDAKAARGDRMSRGRRLACTVTVHVRSLVRTNP